MHEIFVSQRQVSLLRIIFLLDIQKGRKRKKEIPQVANKLNSILLNTKFILLKLQVTT